MSPVRQGLILAASALAGVLAVSALRQSENKALVASTTRDFGLVKPLQHLRAEFEVRNERNEPPVLEGFDDACGIEARVDGNPVVAPGSATKLILQSYTGRRRGPSGSAFELNEIWPSSGRTSSRSYVLTWEVAGNPWFDKAEVWLEAEPGSVAQLKVLGAAETDRIEVMGVPAEFDARVEGQNVEVRRSTGPDSSGYCGDLSLRVANSFQSWEYRMPLFVHSAERIVSAYPEVIRLTPKLYRSTAIGQILGDSNAARKVELDAPSLAVKLRNGRIELTGNVAAGPIRPLSLRLLDDSGKVLSAVTLVVGGER